MKTVHVLALVAGLATAGCTGERNRQVAVSDSLSRDLELAPSDTLAPEPLPEPAPIATDTAGSRTPRVKVGARTRIAAEPRAAPRSTKPRTPRPTRAATTARDSAITEAYSPGANGADTTGPKARPKPARDSVSGVASGESAAASRPPAPATPGTDTVAPPQVATQPVDSAATAPVPTASAPGATTYAPGTSGTPTASNTLPVGT